MFARRNGVFRLSDSHYRMEGKSSKSRVLQPRFIRPPFLTHDCCIGAAVSTILWAVMIWVVSSRLERAHVDSTPLDIVGPLASVDDTATTPDVAIPSRIPIARLLTKIADPGRQTTHMRCYGHADESELCVYENAFCFDGTQVVVASLETTQPYKPKYDTLIPSPASCFDYRHYEASAVEYTHCEYLPKTIGLSRLWRRLFNETQVNI